MGSFKLLALSHEQALVGYPRLHPWLVGHQLDSRRCSRRGHVRKQRFDFGIVSAGSGCRWNAGTTFEPCTMWTRLRCMCAGQMPLTPPVIIWWVHFCFDWITKGSLWAVCHSRLCYKAHSHWIAWIVFVLPLFPVRLLLMGNSGWRESRRRGKGSALLTPSRGTPPSWLVSVQGLTNPLCLLLLSTQAAEALVFDFDRFSS